MNNIDEKRQSRKLNIQIFLSLFVLIGMIGGLTFAFFNYTRTGNENTLKLGNIEFISNYDNVTLNNVFPVSISNIEEDNSVPTVEITVKGKTSYQGGIDYKVIATNVQVQSNGKNVPISIHVMQNDLNTNGNEITLYSYENGAILEENAEFAIGHIKTSDTETDGKVILKVYIDKNYVIITDTPEENTDWRGDKVYLSTSEWNALQNNSGLSFNVKVEATLGEDTSTQTGVIIYNKNGVKGTTPQRQILTGTNDVILGDINTFGFKGWSTTQNATTPTYEVGDNVSLTGINTLYAVWDFRTQAEKLTEDFNTRTVCMQKIDYSGPYTGSLNDGKVVYYMENDESCLKNYVWYSGKLWRIVAIYPNGMMKLVTENPMTAIYFESNTTFNGSYIDNWLTNEFLPTLYNKENIVVQNAEWNVKRMTSATIDPYAERAANDTLERTVGLLNAYEYTNSYTSSYSNSYLHIGQDWWLMTPYSSSYVWGVNSGGNANGSGLPSSDSNAARPSIYLQSTVNFSDGDGTRNTPYKISGDKEIPTNGTSLTNRTNSINGEYVKFNNDVYRVIGLEGTTTKIVKADYIRNESSVLKKKYGSDVYFDTQTEGDYWDKYLVNDWYDSISTSPINYKSMIATNTDTSVQDELAGKYYKKKFSSGSYSNVVDDSNSYYSKVGLLRYGEMFASQLSLGSHINNYNDYQTMWLSTPRSSLVWFVFNYGDAYGGGNPSSDSYAARPSINLVSSVKITCDSGNGYVCDGTYFRPYDLTM